MMESVAEGIARMVGSQEMTIFVVMFLMFVSAFYASKDNENGGQCCEGSKRITEEPECEPTKSGT